MPTLRRIRRSKRKAAPKRRKRRNLVKFIPEADSDFAYTAGSFLSYLKRDPAKYGVTTEEVGDIAKVVTAFRNALAKASHRFTRNPRLVMQKDEARAQAEAKVRMFANIIRADPEVRDSSKMLLRLKKRPKKLGKRQCPQSPPRLQFLGSGDGVAGGDGVGSGSGVHVLNFRDCNESVSVQSREIGEVRRAKPDGAVRVELYFDLVPTGEPVPSLPFERGWPKYLRSFTRSPMEVEFPIPSQPMLVVYWARWADSTGEVSKWSKACVARVEGWSASPVLPVADAARRIETRIVFVHSPIRGELAEPENEDAVTSRIEALGQRVLEAAAQRMLDVA